MSKILVRKVAQCVKTIRKSQNLSQEELADLSGLDRTYISGIERGVRNITLDSLESIVSALDISIDEFLKIMLKMDFD
jgi:transcriptional regulator with XRE-family HTH domain